MIRVRFRYEIIGQFFVHLLTSIIHTYTHKCVFQNIKINNILCLIVVRTMNDMTYYTYVRRAVIILFLFQV